MVSLAGTAAARVVTPQLVAMASGDTRLGYAGNHNETLLRDEGIR